MFWKKLKQKATEKHNYDLTYENVAIPEAVSYTHLDVYKRQIRGTVQNRNLTDHQIRTV